MMTKGVLELFEQNLQFASKEYQDRRMTRLVAQLLMDDAAWLLNKDYVFNILLQDSKSLYMSDILYVCDSAVDHSRTMLSGSL